LFFAVMSFSVVAITTPSPSTQSARHAGNTVEQQSPAERIGTISDPPQWQRVCARLPYCRGDQCGGNRITADLE
jgi:hypothetical protein